MAPPIPLPQVASTIALSFTTGQAEPASDTAAVEPPPVQRADPRPPSLPDVPGDAEPEATPEATPESGEPGDAGEITPPDPGEDVVGATPPPIEPPPEDPVPPRTTYDPSDYDFDYERAPVSSPKSEGSPVFRETDKRLFFSLFVGSQKQLRGYTYFPGMDFKTELAIGGHNEDLRIGGAAVLQVSSGFPVNTLTLAPRLQFNRQILPNYAFYFTTTLTLGYRATTYAGYGIFQGLANVYQHAAVGAVGWGASAIVAERLLLSFRPLNLELAVPGLNLVDFNWDILGGLGVVW